MAKPTPTPPPINESTAASIKNWSRITFGVAPKAFRSLHVFARRPSANYTKVEVGNGADAGDLKDAVCAKLKLDSPPDYVSLLREAAGGGAPVPLG